MGEVGGLRYHPLLSILRERHCEESFVQLTEAQVTLWLEATRQAAQRPAHQSLTSCAGYVAAELRQPYCITLGWTRLTANLPCQEMHHKRKDTQNAAR